MNNKKKTGVNATTDMALHNRKIWCFSIFYFSFNVIELVQIKDSHQNLLVLMSSFETIVKVTM